MTRPLRIEYPGALYHLTSRGDGKENIYLSSSDMISFIKLLGATCERYTWHCYAYCLMNNHYHLLIETPLGNLSKGMQHLNGVYTQRFNKTHKRVGHVFQGRYKSIIVEKDSYLLELTRYIVLNPVRARMVEHVSQWSWSSYLPMIGESISPPWLRKDFVLSLFGNNRKKSQKAYVDFVQHGLNKAPVWTELKNQIYLGSEEFVHKKIGEIEANMQLSEIPKIQYTPGKKVLSLNTYQEQYVNRDKAIYEAYTSGNYSMAQIGAFFELHYSRVSKIVNNYQRERGKT